MNRPNLRRAATALVAVPAAAALLLAPTAWAEPLDSAACDAATAALEDGQAVIADRDTASDSLAAARADARGVVKVIAPDFPVDTATASDVQVAIDETLRPIWQSHPEGSDEYVQWERIVEVAKNLRDALNNHHAALSAAVAVDIAALTATQTEACADVDTDVTPTPDPDPSGTDTPDPGDDPDPSVEPAPTTSETPETSETEQSATTDTPADTDVLYENCAAVRAAGAAPLLVTEPGFRDELDADGDGEACEDTGKLYNPSDNGEKPGDYSQTGDVPIGSAETGQA